MCEKGLNISTAHRHSGDMSEQRKLLFANARIDGRNSIFLEHNREMKVRRFWSSEYKEYKTDI